MIFDGIEIAARRMRMQDPPRKQKVTYNEPGHTHFVTCSCYRRLQLLSKDRAREWVIAELGNAREKLDFDLLAYVIMPEHIHLLVRPRQQVYTMGHILAAVKRPVSVKAKAHLVVTNNAFWLDRLTVRKGEQETFRFWQAGGGFDANLCDERPILEVIDYIHANPVRRGLVNAPTEWKWSSARFWAGDHSGPLAMDSPDAILGGRL
jgi:putative transposase